MKKILLILFLTFICSETFAQRFSQYFTNTLYDSFENPSQKTFTPDTSKQYAFNFFIPNGGANFYTKGDAQVALKSRAFLGTSADPYLVIDQYHQNFAYADANFYYLMFKAYSSMSGDQEIGFSAQVHASGDLYFFDPAIAVTNGLNDFRSQTYYDIFNGNGYYQAYHQLGFTYREQVNKQVAIGFKLSALSGIAYNDVRIYNSSVTFDKQSDNAYAMLAGQYRNSIGSGLTARQMLPTFKNPGAAFSIGTSYLTRDNILLEFNLKDIGFIHWNSKSEIYRFAGSGTINNFSGSGRLDSISNDINHIVEGSYTTHSFTTPADGRFEFGVTKSFWVDGDKTVKYKPAFIASKELFYPGFTGALLNSLQYKNYSASLSTIYDDKKVFRIGGQFMIKSPNAEFFLGSEQIGQSLTLLSASGGNTTAINKKASFTGAQAYIGFSVKLGHVIEHPMNSSYVPMGGEKGPLGRIWNKLFHKTPGGEL